MIKTALITGAGGQDGSYLTEYLLDKGYKVLSIIKKNSFSKNLYDIKNNNLILFSGNVLDYVFLYNIISNYNINECYHLASQSSVYLSIKDPYLTFDVNLKGTINLLECFKETNNKKCKIFFPLSSEIFSHDGTESQLNIDSQFNPMSPYSMSKLSAYYYIKYLRNKYNMFISCGVSWNHESPRRSENFVIPKIIKTIISQKNAINNNKYIPILKLGNIYAKRDWGDARDFIDGFWKQLQLDYYSDLIFSANQIASIKEIVNMVYDSPQINMKIKWIESGVNTIALFKDKVILKIDKELYRSGDNNYKTGNTSETKKILNWLPQYTVQLTLEDMISKYLKEQ